MTNSPNLKNPETEGLNAHFYTKKLYNKVESEKTDHDVYDDKEYVLIKRTITGKQLWDGAASGAHKQNFNLEYSRYKGNKEIMLTANLSLTKLSGIHEEDIKILRNHHIIDIRNLADCQDMDTHRLGRNGRKLVKQAKEYIEDLILKEKIVKIMNDKDAENEALKAKIAELEGTKPKRKRRSKQGVLNDTTNDSTESGETDDTVRSTDDSI